MFKYIDDKVTWVDEKNMSIYGFEASNAEPDYKTTAIYITKYVQITGAYPVKRIDIPEFTGIHNGCDHALFKRMQKVTHYEGRAAKIASLRKYICGAVALSPHCFEGVKSLTIAIHGDYSIRIDEGCFDSDADIKFILPSNMKMYDIVANFQATGKQKRWTLIASKKLNSNLYGDRGDVYQCFPHACKKAKRKVKYEEQEL